MRTLLSRAIQIDPSFHAALGVIVVLAIAEVFFATSYYVGRARANRVSAQAVTATVAHVSSGFIGFRISATGSGGAAERSAGRRGDFTGSVDR